MRKVGHDCRRQGALLGHAIEQAFLLESVHFHEGIDQWSRTVQGQLPIRLTRNGADTKVEVRGCPTVEAKLHQAGCVPLLRRRVVKIGKANRPLQFVCLVPFQEDFRGMSCEDLQVSAPKKPLEKPDGFDLFVDEHRHRLLARMGKLVIVTG